jgi:hypothetical protein
MVVVPDELEGVVDGRHPERFTTGRTGLAPCPRVAEPSAPSDAPSDRPEV